jgi:hypothetical protein
MSEFTAVLGVSKTLKKLLDDHIAASTEPELPKLTVNLGSPKDVHGTSTSGGHPKNAVSLWLYRVQRNPDLLNEPRERANGNALLRASMPIDLHYLVTPIYDTPEGEQALIGKILQVLNDHAVLRGSDLQLPLEPQGDELRLTLETLTVEDLTRIWNSLEEPYQLSLSYVVQLVRIASGHEPERTEPVVTRRSTYHEIVGVE